MQTHRLVPVAVASLLGLCASLPAAAMQTIYWPSFAATPLGTAAPSLIGAPDLTWQVDPATAAKFDRRVDYPTLAATLGLSDAEFARYDLIALEGNGGSPGASGGFESIRLDFDDLRTAVTARYDEVTNRSDNPAVRFLTGSITDARYDATFATRGANPVMSWMLVDLPDGIDAHSPGFNVTIRPGGLSLGGLGEGTPDVDAIGVTASVPEPSSWALMGLGLLGVSRVARRRLRTT